MTRNNKYPGDALIRPLLCDCLLIASKLTQPTMRWLYKCYLKYWLPFRGIVPAKHSGRKSLEWLRDDPCVSHPPDRSSHLDECTERPPHPRRLMVACGQSHTGSQRCLIAKSRQVAGMNSLKNVILPWLT